MNKILILSGMATALLLTSGCGKNASKSSSTFESEEMTEDINSALSNNEEAPQAMTAPTESNGALDAATEPSASADMSGPYVKPTNQEIQESLKNAGFYNGKVDGVIGPRTKKAVHDFQAQHNLTADGRVGRQTWTKLGAYLHQSSVPSAAATSVTPTSSAASADADN